MQSNQIVQVPVNGAHGRHADGGVKSEYLIPQSSCFAPVLFKHEASSQNQQLRPINTSFLQRPMIRNLAPAPSSHFPLQCLIVQSEPQQSSFPHPYPFPSQPVEGRRHMNEEAWRMPSNGCNADTQYGAWISGRNPFPGSLTVTDGMHMQETSQAFVCLFVHIHVCLRALCYFSWL